MKPPTETLRISKRGRDQLLKVRRQTGVEHWNVLCRWAFCISLRETTPPPQTADTLEGGVEMSWKVFSGEYAEIYAALCWHRLAADGLPNNPDAAAACLRAHIHRGLSYLAAGTDTKTLPDFLNKWLLPSQ